MQHLSSLDKFTEKKLLAPLNHSIDLQLNLQINQRRDVQDANRNKQHFMPFYSPSFTLLRKDLVQLKQVQTNRRGLQTICPNAPFSSVKHQWHPARLLYSDPDPGVAASSEMHSSLKNKTRLYRFNRFSSAQHAACRATVNMTHHRNKKMLLETNKRFV